MSKNASHRVTLANNAYSPTFGLPPQTVSIATKESAEWKHNCMDFMDFQATAQNSERMNDLRKCRILSGDFDIRDYSYINDPLSKAAAQATDPNTGKQGKVTPGVTEKIKHYPIMVRPINTILGEYIKRIAQLLGDSEKMVLEVYNHVLKQKENVQEVVKNAINF